MSGGGIELGDGVGNDPTITFRPSDSSAAPTIKHTLGTGFIINVKGDEDIQFSEGGTTPYVYFNGTNHFVGIGTSTPQNTLNVAGDINATGTIYGDGSGLTGISTSPWATSGGDIYNSTATTKVGINTSTPQNTLNVAGDVNVTGTIYSGWELLTNACSSGVQDCIKGCNSGKIVVGGGCDVDGFTQGMASYPANSTTWQCHSDAPGVNSIDVYVICMRAG